jgi:hypothetical protein
MSPGVKLSIHCPSFLGHEATVTLDGLPLRGVESIELSIPGNDVVRATVKLRVKELEVTAETLVMLQAYLEKQTALHPLVKLDAELQAAAKVHDR